MRIRPPQEHGKLLKQHNGAEDRLGTLKDWRKPGLGTYSGLAYRLWPHILGRCLLPNPRPTAAAAAMDKTS